MHTFGMGQSHSNLSLLTGVVCRSSVKHGFYLNLDAVRVTQHGVDFLSLRGFTCTCTRSAKVEAHQEDWAQSEEREAGGFHQEQTGIVGQGDGTPHISSTSIIECTIKCLGQFWDQMVTSILEVLPHHTLPVDEVE